NCGSRLSLDIPRFKTEKGKRKSKKSIVCVGGRILTLPPERGRSPPAARLSVEVVWRIPESLHRLKGCGPGRSAVRRWWYQAIQSLGRRKKEVTYPLRRTWK